MDNTASDALHQAICFGALLRRHRSAAGLTQEELAERACLSRRGIADLERGARLAPYATTVELLAAALGLSDVERAALVAAGRARKTDDVNREPAKAGVAEPDAGGPLYRVLVGNDAEWRELRTTCERALSGIGELVLGRSIDRRDGEPGTLAPDIERALPEVCEELGAPPRRARDPEEDHWRLLTAMTELLRAAALTRPLVLILRT